MPTNPPRLKHLVLVGGGHSQVAVIQHFARNPLPDCQITLISADTAAPYSGMLPGWIAGQYTRDEMHIDLARLCRFAHVRFFHGRVIALNLAEKHVYCQNSPPIPYDILSLNTGSTPPAIPDHPHVLPVKPVAAFIDKLDHLTKTLRDSPTPINIGIVGTGAAGFEVVLAVKRRLQASLSDSDLARIQLHLLGSAATVLPSHTRCVQKMALDALKKANIALHLNFRVEAVDTGFVQAKSGETLTLDALIWATGAAPAGWIAESGLACDRKGFAIVGETLQSTSHPDVFITGDAASLTPIPVPKSGVFAVREGPVLAQNLHRTLQRRPLKPYQPQRRFLSLLNTADGSAIASRGPFAARGRLIGWWKDRIDRRFMRKYQLPPSQQTTHSEHE